MLTGLKLQWILVQIISTNLREFSKPGNPQIDLINGLYLANTKCLLTTLKPSKPFIKGSLLNNSIK